MQPSDQRGLLFIFISIFLLVVVFGAGWLLAPNINSAASIDNNSNGYTMLVGIHGAALGPGQVVALHANGEQKWSYGNSTSYFEVTKLSNGNVLATYRDDGYRKCGPYNPPCEHTGVRIIDPVPTPHIVSEWSYPVRSGHNSEIHDAERLSNGNLLVADMEYERILIINPHTDNIVWSWNASQRYDAPPDSTHTDWLHINDVDRIGKGRYMVSVRNANQILIIERGKGVVEVINEDKPGSSDESCRQHRNQLADYNNDSGGDILCGDPSLLNHQHNPQYLGPGAVLVADSDNNRVVELHRRNGEWYVAWGLSGATGVEFNWPRDADRLPNGNTLITDTRNNRVVEVSRTGKLVASYRVPPIPYEADRIPIGETVGGPTFTSNGSLPSSTSEGVPILTTLLNWLRFAIPLPFWVSEIHVAASLLAVVLTSIGIGQITLPRFPTTATRFNRLIGSHHHLVTQISVVVSVLELIAGILLFVAVLIPSHFTTLFAGLGMLSLLVGWSGIMEELTERFRQIGTAIFAGLSVVVAVGLLLIGLPLRGITISYSAVSGLLLVCTAQLLARR